METIYYDPARKNMLNSAQKYFLDARRSGTAEHNNYKYVGKCLHLSEVIKYKPVSDNIRCYLMLSRTKVLSTWSDELLHSRNMSYIMAVTVREPPSNFLPF